MDAYIHPVKTIGLDYGRIYVHMRLAKVTSMDYDTFMRLSTFSISNVV